MDKPTIEEQLEANPIYREVKANVREVFDAIEKGPEAIRKLTREDVLRAVDVRTEVVNVPEWGGVITVRGMTGQERDSFEAALIASDKRGAVKVNMTNARARLVSICAIDDDGNPLFTKDDVLILSTKSASALDRLYETAATLSGLGDRDLEDLVKN